MSALPWIAGGIGAGVLYYLWRKNQVPATPDDFCAQLCKAAGSFCVDGGWSCRQSNQVIGNFFDPGGAYYSERDRRESVNSGLNGAADILNPPEGVGIDDIGGVGQHAGADTIPQTVGAHTLRYKNGCVPLFGAPGFAKCKTGTLDMYASAINLGAGSPYSHEAESDLTTPGAYVTAAMRAQEALIRVFRVNKNHAMTGGSLDPTTVGPFGTDVVNAPYWYVRGQKVIGTSTTAPRAVVMQHFAHGHAGQEGTTDDQIANLSDADAMALVPIDRDPSVIVTQIGVPCGTPNPGFSWVSTNARTGSGYWTRTKSGSSDKVAPCATLAVNSHVSHTITLEGP